MDIQLFNSLGRKLEPFAPIDPKRARLYTCGLTVYSYAHIGNLRAYLFTDTLRRTLQWSGLDVLHVMNVTDVGHLTSDGDEGDDKVESAAARSGRSCWDITNYYTDDFKRNLESLNVFEPSVWCRATEHIQEMIEFARTIEAGGYSYTLDDGLYFDASKVANYGALGNVDLEGLRAGARVEMKEGKRNPYDFCLWKKSPANSKRLMEWNSPWGAGAPGWHLECSVMSLKYLGAPFDIHTGGVDHRQVHHCNEIAQNQAFLRSDHGGVRFWLHNEFLLFQNEKMSKSSGEFLRLQSLVDWGIHPLAFRFFNLQTHYRSQLVFSFEALLSAQAGLGRMLQRIEALRSEVADFATLATLVSEVRFSRGSSFSYLKSELAQGLSAKANDFVQRFGAVLGNDMATPEAVALLSGVLADNPLAADETVRVVAMFDLALGLNLLSTTRRDLNLRPTAATLSEEGIDALLVERKQARDDKNFRRADEIRDELVAEGVDIEDGRGATAWSWRPRRQ